GDSPLLARAPVDDGPFPCGAVGPKKGKKVEKQPAFPGKGKEREGFLTAGQWDALASGGRA
ncbi:hypothetical protein, partial [Burkholderia sp. SIMBA_051]|uniref:hypothetical protein n=1 Tax=Burkholderia sp. SIMBA_051 TaxID=3085792 RepID=UPI00397DDEDB